MAILPILAAPFYIYKTIIFDKKSYDFFSISRVNVNFLKPKEFVVKEDKNIEIGDADLYRKFHFKDFNVPVPIRHPLFRLIPWITSISSRKEPLLGLKIKGTDREFSLKFRPEETLDFNLGLASQRMFDYPAIRNTIINYGVNKIWKDLFSKSLTKFPKSYNEIFYNLYIYNLRHHLLPKLTLGLSFVKNNLGGVIELPYDEPGFKREVFWFFREGQVYTFSTVTDMSDFENRNLRRQIVTNLAVHEGDPSISKSIYNEFRSLSYDRKLDQEGMMYLYSAWSHVVKELEKVFLEKQVVL